MPAKSQPDFETIHAQLKTIMQKHEGAALKANPDQPDKKEKLIGSK